MNWIQFYIGLALAIAQKSPDEQTKHGCIITDRNNRPLGFGYNGFPRGANDISLPKTRPEKYPWIFHSEENAVANCVHKPENAIAYVTGECCNHCLYTLWQNGVTTVYILNRHGSHLISEVDKIWQKEFIKQTGMAIHLVSPNLDWLKNLPID